MITLGSLFDGSGGFPLAGALSGITPLWASEIEPYPIAVTTSRFPQMKHLGNVAEVDGRKIPPVDIITFGSPCQDMSVAGKRAGMKHREKGDDATTRSGLFYEAIRIIREMRESNNGRYPTFAIWENVPGAFSSNGGEDFRCVLEELAKICGCGGTIPRPANGKWRHAGEIVGDGFSIAWRVLDAQYWGVPQRRKRIYLVADFAGGRAGKILFERESMSGDPESCEEAREGAAYNAPGSAGGSGGAGRVIYALQGNGIDRADTAGCNGCGWKANVSYTLNTIDRPAICFKPNQAVLYEPRSAMDENWAESDVKNALRANASKSSHAVCYALDSLHSNSMKSSNPHSGFHAEPVAKTLQAGGVDPTCNQGGNVIVQSYQKVVGALCMDDYKGPNRQYIGQDKLVVYDCCGNGDGCTVPNLTGDHENRVTDYTAVCIGNGQMHQTELGEKTGALNCMHDQQAVIHSANPPRRYIVRRLTPLECCRLQGFPDGWGDTPCKDRLSDDEYEFWLAVRNTHASVNGKAIKNYTKDQMLKWYNGLHTDSAEYKMWGNGVALPCAYNVVSGCAEELRRT